MQPCMEDCSTGFQNGPARLGYRAQQAKNSIWELQKPPELAKALASLLRQGSQSPHGRLAKKRFERVRIGPN